MHPALEHEHKAEAEAVGLRLRACIRELLAIDPHQPSTAHSLANHLNIDPVVAKRLVKLCRHDLPPTAALTNAPSLKNLRNAIDNAQQRGLDHLAHWAAHDAVNKLERLIQATSHSASKADLTAWLRSLNHTTLDTPDQPTPHPAHRTLLNILPNGSIADHANTVITNHLQGNILNHNDPSQAPDLLTTPPHAVTARTGTLAAQLGERDIATWTDRGTHALATTLNKLLQHHPAATLYLIPTVRDVLSDVQRTRSYLRTHQHPRIRLALDPAALIDPDDTTNAPDLTRRAFESLAPLAAIVMIRTPIPGLDTHPLISHLAALPTGTPIALPNGPMSDTIRQALAPRQP